MNWKVWRWLWGFYLSRYLLMISTPWFAIEISSGSTDWNNPWWLWYGLRAHWSHVKGWNVEEGCHIFLERDLFLSWRVSAYERETR